MAIINKTGITNGGTIQAEHVTRAIDALSGASTDSIIATGSFSGSFAGQLVGSASFATTASFALNASGTGFPYTGSAQITGSLIVTGSARITGSVNVIGESRLSGSLFVSQSDNVELKATVIDVLSAVTNISGSTEIILNTPGLSISDGIGKSFAGIQATLTDGSNIDTAAGTIVDLNEVGNGSNGRVSLPIYQSGDPKAGTIYWSDDTNTLYIYSANSATWKSASFA
jgi:hypothetical protein